MKLLVINGPNINMLGIREPEIYGTQNYESLKKYIMTVCSENGAECDIIQSNHEGVIIDAIQDALGEYDGIVINPAAYTHTSIGILDALKAVGIPAVEVHLSDTDNREEFRKMSYAGMACIRTFKGKGFLSYSEAILFLLDYLNNGKIS